MNAKDLLDEWAQDARQEWPVVYKNWKDYCKIENAGLMQKVDMESFADFCAKNLSLEKQKKVKDK